MKLATILTIFALLLFPLETASAKKPEKNEIRLTSAQVRGANDIEAAIILATDRGSHPGTVILDGSEGPFVYTAPDKSLNIFISSISLQGENNAVITQCDDGLYFEGASIRDVRVENISFQCSGDGVEATGEFHNVTLNKNSFQAGMNGIGSRGGSTGWILTNNRIQAGWDGIRMTGAKNIEITKNDIAGRNGVIVLIGAQYLVKSNTIQAEYQGVLLGQQSNHNTVQANHILGVSLAGIALEPNVTASRILSNKVECAHEVKCLVIDAPSSLISGNQINGNGSK